MELNRERTEDGLQCCTKEIIPLCNDCPYLRLGGGCHNKLMNDAFALIKELTKESSVLTKAILEISKEYSNLKIKYEEIERKQD